MNDEKVEIGTDEMTEEIIKVEDNSKSAPERIADAIAGLKEIMEMLDSALVEITSTMTEEERKTFEKWTHNVSR